MPTPTLDQAAKIAALNRAYNNPATAQAARTSTQAYVNRVNSGTVETLNRIYKNPTLGPVVNRYVPTVPADQISARASQIEQQTTRYGSNRGSAIAGGFVAGYFGSVAKDEAKRDAQRLAKNEWYATPAGKEFKKLESDYINEYGGSNFVDRYVAALNTGETNGRYPQLEDYAKLKAQQAYNDKLQQAIDAYQAKPENRRALYDRMAARGDFKVPEGYKSEALDRYRKQYGNEKTVGDVKPYADLTPDYSNLKPDIVFHPDGTVTYEKPDPNSSNIPLVLAPGQPVKPIDPTRYETVITGIVDARGTHSADRPIRPGYTVYTEDHVYDAEPDIPGGTYTNIGIVYPDGSRVIVEVKIRPGFSITSRPIPGLPPSEADQNPTSSVPQPIPIKPDGTADLKPFMPTAPIPVNAPAPSRASDLLPMRSPQNAPLGNLGSPEQLGNPLLDKLGDLVSAIPAGQPSPFPMNPPPMSRLDPRVPSKGIGENNPVKATSANLSGSPIVSAPETKPPMVSVPTTSNPTKIDNNTAVKAKEQLAAQPKTDPQAQPQKARQCEDPCIQGLHDKADENAKQVEIKVKLFKACKINTTGSAESNTTSNTATDASKVDFEEKTFKVPASESDAYKLLYARIFALESLQCDDGSAIATIPEWWALRRGSDIPQLAILYAEVKSTGKLGDSRWTLHLPHYDKPKGYKPSIPSYTKGNWSSVLKLNDGTRIVVNASTKTEAQRVTNKLKILVPVAQRTNKKGKAIKARIVENQETPFKEVKVIPVRADFYAKGQLSGKPDWVITLRKK